MAKKNSNFRNNKFKSKRLRIIEDHADGDFGNFEDRKMNKKHHDSFSKNIKEEDLEDEYINNY